MLEKDKQRLKQLLNQHLKEFVEIYKERGWTFIVSEDNLDEDSGSFFTSEQELERFAIDPEYVPALTAAYFGYEDLIGILFPPFHRGELYRMLCDYRQEIEGFKTRFFEDDDLIKFAQDFYDVPEESAIGYAQKRFENLKHLIDPS